MNVRFQLLVLEGAKTKEIRKETRKQSLKENSFFCITGVNPFSLTYLSFDTPPTSLLPKRGNCKSNMYVQRSTAGDSLMRQLPQTHLQGSGGGSGYDVQLRDNRKVSLYMVIYVQ